MRLPLILLCVGWILETVLAQCPYMHHRELRPDGSQQCVVGYPAVYHLDGLGTVHTDTKLLDKKGYGDIKSGTIANGLIVVTLQCKRHKVDLKVGERRSDNIGNDIYINEDYKLSVSFLKERKEKMLKGVQIVLSSKNLVFTGANLKPKPPAKEGEKGDYRNIVRNPAKPNEENGCENRVGVTHEDNNQKDGSFIATLKVTKKAEDIRLDVNIMIHGNEWYYSQYVLKSVDAPPTKAPTKEPTKKPTNKPTTAPSKIPPTAGPTPSPSVATLSPTTTPTETVSPSSPENPPVVPPTTAPMLPPSEATPSPTTLSTETLPSSLPKTPVGTVPPSLESAPTPSPSSIVTVAPSSPVAPPTTGTPEPSAPSPPVSVGDSSTVPSWTVTPSVVHPPTVINPALFASPGPVTACCSPVIDHSHEARKLRIGCGPCPIVDDLHD